MLQIPFQQTAAYFRQKYYGCLKFQFYPYFSPKLEFQAQILHFFLKNFQNKTIFLTAKYLGWANCPYTFPCRDATVLNKTFHINQNANSKFTSAHTHDMHLLFNDHFPKYLGLGCIHTDSRHHYNTNTVRVPVYKFWQT